MYGLKCLYLLSRIGGDAPVPKVAAAFGVRREREIVNLEATRQRVRTRSLLDATRYTEFHFDSEASFRTP